MNEIDNIVVVIDANINKMKNKMNEATRNIKNFGKTAGKDAEQAGNKIGENIGKGIEKSVNKGIKDIKIDKGFLSGIGNKFNKIQGDFFGKIPQLNNSLKETEKIFDNLERTGMSLIKNVIMPLGAGVIKVGKMGLDFQDDVARVGVMLDDMNEMNSIYENTIELSDKYGKKLSDIADTQYNALSLGIKDDKEYFLDRIMKFSIVGEVDEVGAMRAATKLMNIYGMAEKEVDLVIDRILEAKKLGDITVPEIAHHIGRVSSQAESAGMNVSELLSMISTLSKTRNPTQAFTGLDAVFTNLLSPSEKMKEYADILDLEIDPKFIKDKGWTRYLDEIRKKTGGNIVALNNLFGSQKAASTMQYILNDGFEEYIGILDQVDNSIGSVDEAYDKLDTKGRSLRESINYLMNSITLKGEEMAEFSGKITDSVYKIGDSIRELDVKIGETALEIAGKITIFAVIAVLIGNIGKLFVFLGKNILDALKILGTFLEALMKLSQLFNGLGGVIMVSVAALAGFLYLVHQTEDDSIVATESIGDSFEALTTRLGGFLGMIGSIVLTIFSTVVGGISSLIGSGLKMIKEMLTKLKGMSDSVGVDWLSDKLQKGINGLDTGIEGINKSIGAMQDKIRERLEVDFSKMNRPMDYIITQRVEKLGWVNIGDRSVRLKEEHYDGALLKDDILQIYKDLQESEKEAKNKIRSEKKDNIFKNIEKDLDKIKDKTKETSKELIDSLNLDLDMKGKDDEISKLMKKIDNEKKKLKEEAKKRANKTKTEAEQIKEKIDEIAKSFQSTTDSIQDSIDMFDRFRIRTTSSSRVMRAARERNKALLERERILNRLEDRGLDTSLMEKLHQTDMNNLADLKALADRLTDTQLMEWQKLQLEANESARRQAMKHEIDVRLSGEVSGHEAEMAANIIFEELKTKLYRDFKSEGISIY